MCYERSSGIHGQKIYFDSRRCTGDMRFRSISNRQEGPRLLPPSSHLPVWSSIRDWGTPSKEPSVALGGVVVLNQDICVEFQDMKWQTHVRRINRVAPCTNCFHISSFLNCVDVCIVPSVRYDEKRCNQLHATYWRVRANCTPLERNSRVRQATNIVVKWIMDQSATLRHCTAST